MQQRKTGTGRARAPLSEILPAARVARFVRMTQKNDGASCASDRANLPASPSHAGTATIVEVEPRSGRAQTKYTSSKPPLTRWHCAGSVLDELPH